MTESRKHIDLIISWVALFIIAFVLFIQPSYFLLLTAPTVFSMYLGVSEVTRPSGGTIEILKLQEHLRFLVIRLGLTPYYIGCSVTIALLLAWRAKKRWRR